MKVQRQDIDQDDTTLYFDAETSSPTKLLEFVQHCELDAWFNMAIASKVQILPLTRQLTNLAGNSWFVFFLERFSALLYLTSHNVNRNKTLNGGRAERNEYILLHEFHKLKYICPDKSWGKKSAAAAVKPEVVEEADTGAPEGQQAAKGKNNKKDKYKGGLVLEPKRGLWDKIVLVMDFNSLYPSIIQEYNIDFTTIERSENDEVRSFTLPRVV